jgi:hypothetical protein
MKSQILLVLRPRHLFFIVMTFMGFVAHPQIIFTTGSVLCNTSGVCLGSECTDPNNVSDGDPTSFGIMNTAVGLGCTVTLSASFASVQPVGSWLGFEVEGSGLATLLANVTLRARNTGTSEFEEQGGSGILNLLATDRGFLEFQTTTVAFDQIELDVHSVLGLAQSLNVYFGFSNSSKLLFPLPVSLVRFDVLSQDQDALLLWRTVSEQNSDRFEIEQSLDGNAFNKIAEVAAAGNSNSEINYSYTDHNIGHYSNSVIYYRLTMVDNDGKTAYSPIRSLHAPPSDHIRTYPIPFHDVIAIDIPVGMSGSAELNITDMQGRLIYHRRDNISDSQTGLVLTGLSALPSSIYVLTIRTPNDIKNIKLVKQ